FWALRKVAKFKWFRKRATPTGIRIRGSADARHAERYVAYPGIAETGLDSHASSQEAKGSRDFAPRPPRGTTLFLQSGLLTTMLRRDELASRTRLPCGVCDYGRCPASHRIIDIAFTLRARRAVPAKDGLGAEMFDPIQGD